MIDGKYLKGAPDLMVEVLSLGSVKHDRDVKFALYEKHGVREYWIVNPESEMVKVWSLDEGAFVLMGEFTREMVFMSGVLGVEIAVDSVFE